MNRISVGCWIPASRPSTKFVMKILFNTLTNQTAPWPRSDQGEIVGLDARYAVLTEAVDPVPDYDSGTHYLKSVTARDGDLWRTTHEVLPLPIPPAPTIEPVTPRQLRLELLNRGLLAGVEMAIASLPEPQKTGALIEWEYASEFQRAHPMVSAIAAAIGVSPETLDEVFTAAAAI